MSTFLRLCSMCDNIAMSWDIKLFQIVNVNGLLRIKML